MDLNPLIVAGYGFVDFDSPQAAEVAVKALQSQGVQAQMAKVIYQKHILILNPQISEFFNLSFHSLEVVSHYRDTQLK